MCNVHLQEPELNPPKLLAETSQYSVTSWSKAYTGCPSLESRHRGFELHSIHRISLRYFWFVLSCIDRVNVKDRGTIKGPYKINTKNIPKPRNRETLDRIGLWCHKEEYIPDVTHVGEKHNFHIIHFA
jgi:hypothetical protein